MQLHIVTCSYHFGTVFDVASGRHRYGFSCLDRRVCISVFNILTGCHLHSSASRGHIGLIGDTAVSSRYYDILTLAAVRHSRIVSDIFLRCQLYSTARRRYRRFVGDTALTGQHRQSRTGTDNTIIGDIAAGSRHRDGLCRFHRSRILDITARIYRNSTADSFQAVISHNITLTGKADITVSLFLTIHFYRTSNGQISICGNISDTDIAILHLQIV